MVRDICFSNKINVSNNFEECFNSSKCIFHCMSLNLCSDPHGTPIPPSMAFANNLAVTPEDYLECGVPARESILMESGGYLPVLMDDADKGHDSMHGYLPVIMDYEDRVSHLPTNSADYLPISEGVRAGDLPPRDQGNKEELYAKIPAQSSSSLSRQHTESNLRRQNMESNLRRQSMESSLKRQSVESSLRRQSMESSLRRQSMESSLRRQSMESSLRRQSTESRQTTEPCLVQVYVFIISRATN